MAGSATTWGVAALADQIASADAPMVARLRDLGWQSGRECFYGAGCQPKAGRNEDDGSKPFGQSK